MTSNVVAADCRHVLVMSSQEFHSIVTDPPYAIGSWDWLDHPREFYDFTLEWATLALHAVPPGAHMLALSGTRFYHKFVSAIEDAGWEIRDCLTWLYGSGFPKNHDVGKRDPAWDGWGTALKPGHELIVMARKPLSGTVLANMQTHATGAININGCRIGTSKDVPASVSRGGGGTYKGAEDGSLRNETGAESGHNPNIGRFPANVVLSHNADCGERICTPDCPIALLDAQSGVKTSGKSDGFIGPHSGEVYGSFARNEIKPQNIYADTGGASRFYYCAKPSTKEKNAGLDGLSDTVVAYGSGASAALARGEQQYQSEGAIGLNRIVARKNPHKTVKPIELMRWMCRLITPPGGHVLDPFAGSGSTGCAASMEGFDFTGIELDPNTADIARLRIAHWAST